MTTRGTRLWDFGEALRRGWPVDPRLGDPRLGLFSPSERFAAADIGEAHAAAATGARYGVFRGSCGHVVWWTNGRGGVAAGCREGCFRLCR